MRVVIAAGGTGGHIYPGIAVAREILRRDENSEVLFVGTARGMETQIVPENNFQLSLINSAGLKNVGLLGQIKGLALLPRSFIEARRILREFKPDVVVGAGGYVSGPVLLSASFMRFPTLVMDSNALPGFTNRRLARFVDRAAVAFPEALKFFGAKGVLTGNPVRSEFFDIAAKVPDAGFCILIFGGSQGSRAINDAMVAALPLLEVYKDRIGIMHQTGEADFKKVRDAYERSEWTRADVRPYISDMVSAFAEADVVICRAGATTCSELAAAGRPAIMIPLPTAADDHQRKNAEAMAAAGAATVILQRDLRGDQLAARIKKLMNDQELLVQMSAAGKKLGREDAAAAAVNIIEELAQTNV